MMSINAMDTLMVDVSVDGMPAFMGGTILTTPIAMGGAQTFNISNFSYSSFSASTTSSNLCMNVTIPHNTNSGTSQNCQTVKLSLGATGVAQVNGGNAVNVFPNPANASLNLTSTEAIEGAFLLLDVSGKVVANSAVSGTTHTVETANYANGLYFYKLTGKDGAVLQQGKVVINH